jgi:hypothetical protein
VGIYSSIVDQRCAVRSASRHIRQHEDRIS